MSLTNSGMVDNFFFFIPIKDYIPVDGIPRSEIVTVSIPVSVIFILLEVCGIIFAAVCLIFNISYRNKKYVYMQTLVNG